MRYGCTGGTGPGGGSVGEVARWLFVEVGPFPIMLVVLFIVFGLLSQDHRFWDGDNIFNIARQSTYLMIATMGQMLYLLSRNYDLSNGSTVAMTGIVTALVMTWSVGRGQHRRADRRRMHRRDRRRRGRRLRQRFRRLGLRHVVVHGHARHVVHGVRGGVDVISGVADNRDSRRIRLGSRHGKIYEPVDGWAISHVFRRCPS